jgi:ribonuclease HI
VTRREYLCYTDGSCKPGEHAPGGWGFFIKPPSGEPTEGYGSAERTLAKIMEYTAVAEAISTLPHDAIATVFSDNQALVANLTNKLRDWRASDFRNVDPDVVDCVRRIATTIEEKRLRVTWQWIRAHNGNAGNERADALAAQGARESAREAKTR